MATSESQELNEIIRRVFEEEHGQRASHGEVSRSVMDQLPRHILGHYAQKAIRTAISQFFNRRTEDDLPYAPVVNDDGEHVHLEIMNFDEHVYVARTYLRKRREYEVKAYTVGDRVREKFGRDLVVDGMNLSLKKGVA